MELKDITSSELVEILLKRVKKLQDIDEYHPLYSRDIVDEVEEIIFEIKSRNNIRMKKIEKEKQ